MSGSVFGQRFTVSTWGESHGAAIGAVVDGCPAGICIDALDIQKILDRRKPGTSPYATPRNEPDSVEILSGLFEGRTTGTPISMMIKNTNQRSSDYSADIYRPGHADHTYDLKYGFRDYRGGGRASGRETAARVAAGAVAMRFLAEIGTTVTAYTHSIGDIEVENVDLSVCNNLNMPDNDAYQRAKKLVELTMQENDSLGGQIICCISGVPKGLGEPVFNKLEALLGHAVLSIGGVKGIDFGAGFASTKMTGSMHNDIKAYNAGGMYGGISDGSAVTFTVAVKPTPSIAKCQDSINKQGESVQLSISGRHDPLIVPRAVVVVEAMAALVIADLVMLGLSSNIDNIKKILQ